MGKPVRLYRRDDTLNTVGIPAEGELFDPDDAARLVGQGIATTRAPGKAKPKRKTTPPAPPAPEG